MKGEEFEKFCNKIAGAVEDQFIIRGLADSDLFNFYAGTLAQLLEWAISDMDYSKEEILSALKKVSIILNAGIKRGKSQRKKEENKNE